jgi:phosphonate transport system permease protein
VGLLAFVTITAAAAVSIGLDIFEIVRDLTRGASIWAEFFPPDLSFAPRTFDPILETFQMAVIASVIGCGLALPVAFLASIVTAPGRFVLLGSRGVLSVVRALPDLLYAMVFVAAVSIGPLPGIMALIFFNVGVTVKLLSETLDGVDRGPIEAAQAAGATRWQVNRSAVLPQVLPHYVAYALYVFELNIRASAVLGIVGAGGIGQLFNERRKVFAYDDVSLIVVELFVFVFIIELVSIALRRRLV